MIFLASECREHDVYAPKSREQEDAAISSDVHQHPFLPSYARRNRADSAGQRFTGNKVA